MRIVSRGHSCVEVSTIDGSILVDPGGFSDLEGAFEQQQAVLITHEHPDMCCPRSSPRQSPRTPPCRCTPRRRWSKPCTSCCRPSPARGSTRSSPGAQVTVGGIQV
ncbi:MBL fold metallo-hydrolase, partial [Arthrobacter sp. JCM 19049]|uniref:MBL fold metallo-hydrolase n=1 Tax=Arthrobacter sp. JCM 19049 TaxID=1460643 RepID=UPI0024373B8B